MGNICSRGAERDKTSKKDENLPDKPRDGEDEALLAGTVAEGGAVANEKQGDEGTGLGGIVDGVCDDVKNKGDEAVQTAVEEAKIKGEEVKEKGEAEVKVAAEKGEEKVKAAVEDVKASVTNALGSVTDQTVQGGQELDKTVQSQATDALEDGQNKLKEETKKEASELAESAHLLKNETSDLVNDSEVTIENRVQAVIKQSETSVSNIKDSVEKKIDQSVEESKEKVEGKTMVSDALQSGVGGIVEVGKTGNETVDSKIQEGKGDFFATVESLEETQKIVENNVQTKTSDTCAELQGGKDEAAAAGFVEEYDKIQSGVSGVVNEGKEFVAEKTESTETAVNNAVEEGKSSVENQTEDMIADDVNQSASEETGKAADEVPPTATNTVFAQNSSAMDEVKDAAGMTSQDLFAEVAKQQEEAGIPGLVDFGREFGANAANMSLVEGMQHQAACAVDDGERVTKDVKGDVQSGVNEAMSSEKSVMEDLAEGQVVSPESECFLEKARGLLEAHRSSLDGDKALEEVPQVKNDAPTQGETEETARQFVEGIIEKATAFVASEAESTVNEQNDSVENEPSVERGEETLPNQSRGVCFASPSSSSSVSSSSPTAYSPPAPVGAMVSPPSESASPEENGLENSIDNFNNINHNNNNNNSSVLDNNVADSDDPYIQRVAMEVTTKAVHDAIKIVTENGTGVLSSPSDPGELTDDLTNTTTDSSQVERGSPVSELTSGLSSQTGSVTESLSSYDPGQAFRQDLVDIQPGNKEQITICPTPGSEETTTPTNSSAAFDSYPSPTSPSDPPPTVSQVPSSLPGLDKDQPSIVIDSPDCAHRMAEDSTPEEQSEPTATTTDTAVPTGAQSNEALI